MVAIIAGFFLPFFWPKLQLLVTPDFGRSDSWHFSFPTKFLLWQSLQENRLPLWSAKIGNGFPILGEGQTGIFFLPNLILYKFFRPVIAYNLSLVSAVTTLAVGIYFWIRLMGAGTLLAFYGGITLAFSAAVMTQLPHITLLQGLSLFPWIAAACLRLAQKKSLLAVALLVSLISQQIFTGFPQAVFVTLFFCGVYYLWQTRQSPTKVKDIGLFILAVSLAVAVAAVQILPSYEFLKNSTVSGGLTPDLASYFSFPLKHLLSFLTPFALGNPKLATYPPFYEFDGSIFWENTGYVGLLPLLLPLFALWPKLWRRPEASEMIFFSSVGFFSFLLMLGKHSPLYLIYAFWPFNLFRVPSRFLWLFLISLIILGVRFTNLFLKSIPKKLLITLILTLSIGTNIAGLYKIWRPYHLLASANLWLKPPEIVGLINPEERIITLGAEEAHNQIFLKRGWPELAPYLFLRNSLAPDTNVIWGISNAEVYAGRFLRRPTIITNLLHQSLSTADLPSGNPLMSKLLNLLSIRTVLTVSARRTSDENAGRSVSDGTSQIKVFENLTAFPRAYLASRAITVKTLEEALNQLNSPDFKPGQTVLLERSLALADTASGGRVEILAETDTQVHLRVIGNDVVAPLVLTDTYYPGWKAAIDGKQVEILAANIAQRAIVVPPGTHEITFSYEPQTLYLGAAISTIAFIFTVFLAAFAQWRVFSHNLQKVS